MTSYNTDTDGLRKKVRTQIASWLVATVPKVELTSSSDCSMIHPYPFALTSTLIYAVIDMIHPDEDEDDHDHDDGKMRIRTWMVDILEHRLAFYFLPCTVPGTSTASTTTTTTTWMRMLCKVHPTVNAIQISDLPRYASVEGLELGFGLEGVMACASLNHSTIRCGHAKEQSNLCINVAPSC